MTGQAISDEGDFKMSIVFGPQMKAFVDHLLNPLVSLILIWFAAPGPYRYNSLKGRGVKLRISR